jgi:hypothetical protein
MDWCLRLARPLLFAMFASACARRVVVTNVPSKPNSPAAKPAASATPTSVGPASPAVPAPPSADELLERAWSAPSEEAFETAWKALGSPALVAGVPSFKLAVADSWGKPDPWAAGVGKNSTLLFGVAPPTAVRWFACEVTTFLAPTIMRCADKFVLLPSGTAMRLDISLATARGDRVYAIPGGRDRTSIRVLDLARAVELAPFTVPGGFPAWPASSEVDPPAQLTRRWALHELGTPQDGAVVVGEWIPQNQDGVIPLAAERIITVWGAAAPDRPLHTFAERAPWNASPFGHFAVGPHGEVAVLMNENVFLVEAKTHHAIEVSACKRPRHVFFDEAGNLRIATSSDEVCVIDSGSGAVRQRTRRAEEGRFERAGNRHRAEDAAWAALQHTLCSADGRPFPASFCRAHGVAVAR